MPKRKKIAEKSDRVVPNYLHTCKNALGYLILALNAQYAERILNKVAKLLNETFIGLKCMSQVFKICFDQNPRLKGIESYC